jgi:glutaminase
VSDPGRFTSSGALPPDDRVRAAVDAAYERARGVGGGAPSDVYPALAAADPDRLGVSVVAVDGRTWEAGDAAAGFAIMSVAKPFVFALVCSALGVDVVRERVGLNATGLAFNATEAVALRPDGLTNPMVNPGAIATASLVPGDDAETRWRFVADGLSAFAGRPLDLDDDVLASALATNHRNRELTAMLAERGAIEGDPAEAVERYTRQSCLRVTAHDLAAMGATLADGGVQPFTGARVVAEDACRATLAAMTTAGLYETSGEWLVDVGLPGKSGIGGGIVTVSPGKGALGTFSPRLDPAGNSVSGQVVAADLARTLGLDLFASAPVTG